MVCAPHNINCRRLSGPFRSRGLQLAGYDGEDAPGRLGVHLSRFIGPNPGELAIRHGPALVVANRKGGTTYATDPAPAQKIHGTTLRQRKSHN
jgi:hypothetical protein